MLSQLLSPHTKKSGPSFLSQVIPGEPDLTGLHPMLWNQPVHRHLSGNTAGRPIEPILTVRTDRYHTNMYPSSQCTNTPLNLLITWCWQSRIWCPNLLGMVHCSGWKSSSDTGERSTSLWNTQSSGNTFWWAIFGASTHTTCMSVLTPLWSGKVIPGKSFLLEPWDTLLWVRFLYRSQRMVNSH